MIEKGYYFYNKNKNLDSAYKYYSIAERNGCSSAELFNNIGDILYKRGNKDAINYFYLALALNKTEKKYYFNIATYYYNLNEVDSLEKYIPFLEDGLAKYIFQAQTFLNFNKYDSAIIYFNKAYKVDQNCLDKFKIALCYY